MSEALNHGEHGGHGELLRSRVAIIGTGLIGGSLGLALRQAGMESVTGWDSSDAVLAQAVECGAMSHAAATAEAAVEGASLIVLAVPVTATIPTLRKIAPSLASDAVVTDVGSTKARIVRQAEALLGGRFVGGHPMAGSEQSGIAHASAGLFAGAPWLLTPTTSTNAGALKQVQQIAEAAGAVVSRTDPKSHDAAVAYLSHLPHLLAYALAQAAFVGVPKELRDAGAGSFRDGTRVAAADPQHWADILMDNRDPVAQTLTDITLWATRARRCLEREDSDGLAALLAEAHKVNRLFRPGAS